MGQVPMWEPIPSSCMLGFPWQFVRFCSSKSGSSILSTQEVAQVLQGATEAQLSALSDTQVQALHNFVLQVGGRSGGRALGTA